MNEELEGLPGADEDDETGEIPVEPYDIDAIEEECLRTFEFLRSEPELVQAFKEHVGLSFPFFELLREVVYVAKGSYPVFLLGETGTGKECVARALHLLSDRPKDLFRVFNCANCPDSARQRDELFGHWKGAFQGADHDQPGLFHTIDGGTLFLDEIGHLKRKSQAMLNRATQPVGGKIEFERLGNTEKPPDSAEIRFVSAFNESLTWNQFQIAESQKRVREGEGVQERLEDTLLFLDEDVTRLERWSDEELESLGSWYREGCQALAATVEGRSRADFNLNQKEMGIRFNEDLGFRLFKYTIRIPPLRFRAIDAVAIAHFLSQTQSPRLCLTDEELLAIAEHAVGGNVRGIEAALLTLTVHKDLSQNGTLYHPIEAVGRNLKDGQFTADLMRLLPSLGIIRDYVERIMALWPEGEARPNTRPGRKRKFEAVPSRAFVEALIECEGDVSGAAKAIQGDFVSSKSIPRKTFEAELDRRSIVLSELREILRRRKRGGN